MPRNLPDLLRVFDSLPAVAAEATQTRFVARPIPAIPTCHVAKDANGLPVIIVETDGVESRRQATPLVLEKLSIVHGIDCRLLLPDASEEFKRASVIRCTDNTRQLHEYFLRAVLPVILSLPARPSRQQVTTGVNTLVTLFSQLSQAPRKTLMGLWAELFIIERARDPSLLLRSWHATPEERFDFAQANQRLEVKAAAGRFRSHQFGLEQLRPPAGTTAVIASLLLERSAGGDTLNHLRDRIAQFVDDARLVLRMDEVIAQTLGSDWEDAASIRFDHYLAIESCRFFSATTIPSVGGNLPPEISDVHFRVDLTDLADASPDELAALGELALAALHSQ